MAPNIQPDWMARAIAASGVGLDHVEGERVVAVGNDSAGDAFDEFFLLTDRRLSGRSGRRWFQVPLAGVAHVEWRNGVIDRSLHVTGAGGAVDATVYAFVQPLATMLDVLSRVPDGGRLPPAEPLCVQTPEDPTGAAGALAAMGHEDPRFALMLHLLHATHRQGRLDVSVGADLVARVVLHYRTTWAGRGMREGRWLSPLWAQDLAHALPWLFGPPVRKGGDGRAIGLDFAVQGASDAAGRAVASSAVGLLSLAVLGVGWVSVPGRSLREVRVWVADEPAPPSFVLEDASNGEPLSDVAPDLVRWILRGILERELPVLVRRCVFGWDPSPAELLALPGQAVAGGFHEALGGVDLTPLAAALG